MISRRFLIGAVAGVYVAMTSGSLVASTIYKLDGKDVGVKDLSPSIQQQLYEINFEAFERTRMTVENSLFEAHVEEEAKKSGKSKDETMDKILDVKEPTDKEVKKFYEENKSKIPPQYKFEDVKADIAKYVKQEKQKAKRDDVLAQIKKTKKFTFAVAKPEAPVMDVKTAGFQVKGDLAKAKVKVVEFADYQCPHCKMASETLKKISEKMKDKVAIVFIDYPVNPSGISKIVAEAAQCAGEQNKFWEFHYKAFDMQSTLDKSSPEKIAKDLKLNEANFKSCVDSAKTRAIVESGKAEGERLGVTGTPFILINGKRYVGAHSVEAMTKEIEANM